MDERLLETIVDIAFNAGWRRPEDVDSRDLVWKIVDWAREFEKKYKNVVWNEGDMDYLVMIDRFANEKLDVYLK